MANILRSESSIAKQAKLPLYLGGISINKTNAASASLKDVICWRLRICETEIKCKAGLTKQASVSAFALVGAENEFIWKPVVQSTSVLFLS